MNVTFIRGCYVGIVHYLSFLKQKFIKLFPSAGVRTDGLVESVQ